MYLGVGLCIFLTILLDIQWTLSTCRHTSSNSETFSWSISMMFSFPLFFFLPLLFGLFVFSGHWAVSLNLPSFFHIFCFFLCSKLISSTFSWAFCFYYHVFYFLNGLFLIASCSCFMETISSLISLIMLMILSDQIRSVAQSCPTLCDPMNCSTPGLPVHHQLSEFTQTHVHRVGDAIQPPHPLSSPSPPAPNPSQHQSPFQWVNSLHEVAKVLEFQL